MKKITTDHLTLREIHVKDPKIIHKAFQMQGWEKPVTLYQKYLKYQETGERDIIIAILSDEFAGYLTIQWQSDYLPFQKKEIPEIIDFNVLKKFQRQNIGTILMDEAERRIKKKSKYAGIGFGVTQDYGAAQILYIRRNYIPDGNGLVINSKPVQYEDQVTINDDLVFYLTKEL